MNEYKKLLVLLSAINNLKATPMPIVIVRKNLFPLKLWAEGRIKELGAKNE